MRWLDIRQLKALRRFPVPPEVLVAGRVRIVALVETSPMRAPARFASFAWRPVMAALLVVVVVTGGGTAFAASGALPGERLYVVKIAAEGVSESLAFTPERRFVVQAAHASRRLEETEALIARREEDGLDVAARVREAMGRYEDHVFVMNEIVVRFAPDAEKPRRDDKALAAAERMLERHARLIESATGVGPAIASVVIDPIDATLSLEDDVYSVIPADDGEDEERDRGRRAREERVGESLKRLRAELRDRDAREPDRRDDDGRRRESEDVRGDGRPDEGEDRDAEDRSDAGARLDFRLETPLEIKVGM